MGSAEHAPAALAKLLSRNRALASAPCTFLYVIKSAYFMSFLQKLPVKKRVRRASFRVFRSYFGGIQGPTDPGTQGLRDPGTQGLKDPGQEFGSRVREMESHLSV